MAKETGDRRGATTAQLQNDINSGRTGDKTPGFDPAAAPLGTDEEAGGFGPSPELIAAARRAEAKPGLSKGPMEGYPEGTPSGVSGRKFNIWIPLAAAVLVAVGGGLWFGWMG